MKTLKRTTLGLGYLLILSIFQLLGCSKNTPSPATPQSQTLALLTASPWKLQTSSVDGVDQTALYKDFSITFTSTGYTTTKGGAIWPASDTWTFQGTSATSITRGDGATVQIEASSSSLVMSINWTTTSLGSGRVVSTKGDNVFTMVK
jgi:hypothetical protein